MTTTHEWAAWAAREAQDLAWDRLIWQRIHDAELTSQPYPRTDDGGKAYGFPAFTAAERDVLDVIHADALSSC